MSQVMVSCQNHRLATANAVVSDAVRRLEAALQCSIRERVRIDFHEGILVLRGQARSFYHKQLIQEAVRGIEGVADIVNSVDVT